MSAPVDLAISRFEAEHLARLVRQFDELVADADDADPAIRRLVPDTYRDDAEAAAELRALTQADLLDRRRSDAAVVLAALDALPGDAHRDGDLETVHLTLADDAPAAWLRTLAAVRLVLATRLGIMTADDHEAGDPRFGLYDWLGFRLDGLVNALSRE